MITNPTIKPGTVHEKHAADIPRYKVLIHNDDINSKKVPWRMRKQDGTPPPSLASNARVPPFVRSAPYENKANTFMRVRQDGRPIILYCIG